MKVLVFLIALLNASNAFSFSFTKTFSESELQAQIDARMPIAQQVFLFKVLIEEPKLDLISTSDRFNIATKVSITLSPELIQRGTAEVSGSLDYRPETGSFYVSDAKIESLNIDGLSQSMQKQVKHFAQQLIAQALSEYPVYTFQDHDTQQKLAKSSIKSMQIKNETLIVKLGVF
jgi:hypothetical protein